MVVSSIRPTWTEYYLGIAEAVAKRGECTRRQVGAVIVNHHTIIATGYNGSPPGKRSCLDGSFALVNVFVDDAGHRGAQAGRARTVGATMYVTSEPCDLCSSLLDAAGIARTIWR